MNENEKNFQYLEHLEIEFLDPNVKLNKAVLSVKESNAKISSSYEEGAVEENTSSEGLILKELTEHLKYVFLQLEKGKPFFCICIHFLALSKKFRNSTSEVSIQKSSFELGEMSFYGNKRYCLGTQDLCCWIGSRPGKSYCYKNSQATYNSQGDKELPWTCLFLHKINKRTSPKSLDRYVDFWKKMKILILMNHADLHLKKSSSY